MNVKGKLHLLRVRRLKHLEIPLLRQVLRGFVPDVIWPGEPGFFMYALTKNIYPLMLYSCITFAIFAT